MEDETPLNRKPDLQPWTKAILPARDRLQSHILVGITVPVLCYLTVTTFRRILPFDGRFIGSLGRFDDTLTRVVLVSLIFALAAWRLRAATPLAAACGGMICFLITGPTQSGPGSSVVPSGLSPLLLLFILTFEATRLGRASKAAAGLAENSKGRDAAQIVANLGIAALSNSSWGYYLLMTFGGFEGEWAGGEQSARRYFAIMSLPMLAALAEAAGDTVSSEIGQAFGGRPILLTTLRRVQPGTDGAISPIGTLAGIAAAAVIAASGAPALSMSLSECTVAFAAGVLGLFFDSILGATLERRGWIGNDLVNLTSTAFAAATSLAAVRFFGDSLAGFR